MSDHGGYTCPHCGHREFVPSLIAQHIRQCHPEETTK